MPVGKTHPHDYRVLFSGPERPIVVGGQAVNLWAITYLEQEVAAGVMTKYGSDDMDIVKNDAVIQFLKTLPNWHYVPTRLKFFNDIRIGAARGVAADGRKLLVEVLHSVYGLEEQDMLDVEVEYAGTTYRILDPVSLLKAKAANLRDFPQNGPTPRHDAVHLTLIADCLPRFLADVALNETDNPEELRRQIKTVSRAFLVLQDPKIAATLEQIGIDPKTLIPESLKTSPNPKVRNAVEHQMKLFKPRSSPLLPADKPAVHRA